MSLKITDNTFNKFINDLNAGELFTVVDDGSSKYKLFHGVFMKISNKRDNRNAVRLNTGELFCINNNMFLQRIKGELVI